MFAGNRSINFSPFQLTTATYVVLSLHLSCQENTKHVQNLVSCRWPNVIPVQTYKFIWINFLVNKHFLIVYSFIISAYMIFTFLSSIYIVKSSVGLSIKNIMFSSVGQSEATLRIQTHILAASLLLFKAVILCPCGADLAGWECKF